ncbi:MAG TPA: glycoside hydrolase family 88 protein [Lachnospiraceae bacterium]|nr:glycoside hydrolase family 88 protein [Lachnospiraceae bacterium]
MKIQYDKELLLVKIDQIVNKTMTMDMTWEWPCGVAYYGVSKAYEVTGNRTYLDMLIEWTNNYIKLGLPEWNVNTCAMGHTMITLYQATGNQMYLDIIKSKVEYLSNSALRFGDGVLQHTVSSDNDFPEQAWADTLFMAAFFLLRAGVLLDSPELIKDALHQYDSHISFLQDESTGLWYHGYNHVHNDHMSGFFWGRANAWAAYTMSQVKLLLKDWYLYPECMNIECSLRDQLATLKLHQTSNGLWRTIIDDKEAYEEISASCGIAAAMIHNQNPLHTKYIQDALASILDNISKDGRVLHVSGGTAVMKDKEGYLGIPNRWIQGWGQGLALAFLTAILEQ